MNHRNLHAVDEAIAPLETWKAGKSDCTAKLYSVFLLTIGEMPNSHTSWKSQQKEKEAEAQRMIGKRRHRQWQEAERM
jgi:hypothetical protein